MRRYYPYTRAGGSRPAIVTLCDAAEPSPLLPRSAGSRDGRADRAPPGLLPRARAVPTYRPVSRSVPETRAVSRGREVIPCPDVAADGPAR